MRVLNQITFEARDDAEALKLASERLGKEAVILSTRVVRVGGFMGFFQQSVLQVTAGILQDDSKPEKAKDRDKDDTAAKERLVAFQKLLEFKQATEARAGAEDRGAVLGGAALGGAAQQQFITPNGVTSNGVTQNGPQQNGAAKVIYSPASVGIAGREAREFDSVHISQAGLATGREVQAQGAQVPAGGGDPDTLKLKEEVDSLSKRLDLILERLDKQEPGPSREAEDGKSGRFEPGLNAEKAEQAASPQLGDMEDVYQRLVSSEVEPDYALALVREYQEQKAGGPFVKWLESKIKCASDAGANVLGGKRVMLFGPTGAGKTTTIAKLAAIQALWEHKNVLLLTSDTYRIAAVDQLRTYAKILGVPLEVIFEVENFAQILAEHEDADLILLDTAGRGQKDRKNLETFEVLHDVFKPDAVHLVLAANMKYRDMLDVMERMSGVPVSHVIFTKLDETVSYGTIFNAMKSLDCPVSFFTTGQNVPNDIEVASGERLAGLLMGDEVRSATP